MRGFCHIGVESEKWAGTASSGFWTLSPLGWAQTQDPGSACAASAAGWLHLRRGLWALEVLTQGRDKATVSKSLLVSCALCHIFTVQHPLQSGCPRKPQDSVLISQGLQQQQLGMGGPAGATAGFAVIPVATEVHFDCQCTVGAWLVLAAVIWRWDTVQKGRIKCWKTNGKQLPGSPTLAILSSQKQELTKVSPAATL